LYGNIVEPYLVKKYKIVWDVDQAVAAPEGVAAEGAAVVAAIN
jgi:hypothetical protein